MQTFSPKIPWGRFSNLLWLTSVFTPALTSEQTLYFYHVPHFLVQLVPSELYFVQWKHHISICYCFDFRCSCRTCHNKKTIQQDFVRIWTDSGVYRDSIIVAIWNLTPTQTGFLKVSPLIFKNLLFINFAKACNEVVSNNYWGPAHWVLVLWSRSIGHPLWFYFLGLRNASVWRKSVIFLSLQFQKGV